MTIMIRFLFFPDSSSSSVFEKSDVTLTSSIPALTLGVPPNIEFNKNVDDDNKEDNSNDSERDKDKTVQKSRWVKTCLRIV